MSLVLKNRTVFNSLYSLDATCFTKQNSTDGSKPFGVLGGTVAAFGANSYTAYPGNGANQPIGLFVNDAAGAAFDNAPAVASNKIAIACKQPSVEVDVYANVTFTVGEALYSDANGYLTNVKPSTVSGITNGKDVVIGYVSKKPTTADPFLGVEMCI